jgi:hypothetical protein
LGSGGSSEQLCIKGSNCRLDPVVEPVKSAGRG